MEYVDYVPTKVVQISTSQSCARTIMPFCLCNIFIIYDTVKGYRYCGLNSDINV